MVYKVRQVRLTRWNGWRGCGKRPPDLRYPGQAGGGRGVHALRRELLPRGAGTVM